MKKTLLKALTIWCLYPISSFVGAQSIVYQWLNQSCSNVITCDNGCTACNVPENSDGGFFGTNTIWIGVTKCPYSTGPGDNSIFSTEWPAFVTPGSYAMLSGIATTPMQVDSIIIRHARTSSGPERLRVSLSRSPMEPFETISDEYIHWDFHDLVITDLGCLEIPPGNPYATFQLKFQAYEATGEGSWILDGVSIVGSPCSTFSTGIPETRGNLGQDIGPFVDVLGRPVGANAAPGVYMGGRKVVTIF